MFKVIKYEDSFYEEVVNLNLRKSDILEVEAANATNYKDVLKNIVIRFKNNINLILYNNKVSAIFGVLPSTKEILTASIFFLSDDNFINYKLIGTKYAKQVFIPANREKFRYLVNFVSIKNQVSIKWLRVLGAKFEQKIYKLKDKKTKFLKFYIKGF